MSQSNDITNDSAAHYAFDGNEYDPAASGASDTTLATTMKHMEAYMANQAFLETHPDALARIQAQRMQQKHTIQSSRLDLSDNLPRFGGGKPYPPPMPKSDWYVVEFDGHDDPLHPQNWPTNRKLCIFAIFAFLSLAITMASSLFGAGSAQIQEEFNVGAEVATLGVSLFVFGYCFGPIIFAPMSELYGRRLPTVGSAFGFAVFNIAVAVAKDLQTVMICRFFAGVFGSSPLTVVPSVLADMFDNKTRGLAIAAFSATILSGPLASPFIGGFIVNSNLGWRWTCYIPAFLGFAATVLTLFWQKESYGPSILVTKATELRRKTKNWAIHARQEEVEVDFRELVVKNIGRPVRMLFTEPIILLITLYMGFLYGFFYLSLTAYTLVFSGVYGMSPGVSGLPQIGMIIGILFGLAAIAFMNPGYGRKLDANNNVPVPEWRLVLPMAGGICFAIGLFWFGWTGFTDSIPWIVPTLSGLFLGFGIYVVFLQCVNYIIDAYLEFSASAVAANTIVRSLFGAIFPLFGTYMFNGMGINYAMTFLGCLATLFIPMPFVFYRYGKQIRARSKFAPTPPSVEIEKGNGSKRSSVEEV